MQQQEADMRTIKRFFTDYQRHETLRRLNEFGKRPPASREQLDNNMTHTGSLTLGGPEENAVDDFCKKSFSEFSMMDQHYIS